MSKLSWEPVRRGRIYCSSGCGRGCTAAENLAATGGAKQLAAELGEGWTSNVWENLGWHFKAVSACGRICVHRYSDERCTAFLGPAGSGAGVFTATASTPRAAVTAVCRKALDGIEEIQALLAGLVEPRGNADEKKG